MRVVVTERKMKSGTRIDVDVVISAEERAMCQKSVDKLYDSLSQVFRDAYKEGVLVTDDYFALCDIAIKQAPTISYKRSFDLQMTAGRVVIKLSGQKEKYIKRIEECFRKFYDERT